MEILAFTNILENMCLYRKYFHYLEAAKYKKNRIPKGEEAKNQVIRPPKKYNFSIRKFTIRQMKRQMMNWENICKHETKH